MESSTDDWLEIAEGILAKYFGNVVDIAIFVPRNSEKTRYLVIARATEDEGSLILINIWKNGKYLLDNQVFPKDRLSNFNGKVIKATAFNLAPYNYKDNPNDENYQGSEVCIAHILTILT